MIQPPPHLTWTRCSQAGTLDDRQRQHTDQVPERDTEMEPRRDHERWPILALLAAAHGFEVNKPHLALRDGWLGHADLSSQGSPIGVSAHASSSARAV